MTAEHALTLLYDGGCPLCVREVEFLRRKDQGQRMQFVDINAADYCPETWSGITYRQAMARIHAIDAEGTVLKDVAVFRAAYRLIGLGWIYAPTKWPLIGPVIDAVYTVWARYRLLITRRPSLDQLCNERCERTGA